MGSFFRAPLPTGRTRFGHLMSLGLVLGMTAGCFGQSARVGEDGITAIPNSALHEDTSAGLRDEPNSVPAASSAWDAPWQRTTSHWVFKTNHSEALADQVAVALEDAYSAFANHFGKRPRGATAMNVLGFKTYEDYKAYCMKVGASHQLAATGFSPSEAHTCCCWDKHGDSDHFVTTMVHEACHLYHFEATRRSVPSWLAEGMATYFEGFTADGQGHLTFHHRPASRLASLKKVLGAKTAISLSDLAHLKANELINNDPKSALAFYATSWGYYYFFNNHPHKQWRDGFARYVEAATTRGAKPDLQAQLGTRLEVVEEEFARYMGQQ